VVIERRAADAVTVAGPDTDLREALAARDELIAVVGHELRNAMAPLVLLTQQFEAMPVDDLMRAKVAMLTRNLNALLGTLDRVSEVAQLRDGKLVLEPTPVDVGEVVREVGVELTTLAKAAGAELRIDAPTIVGTWDRDRLKQIVDHLVNNAIRYAGGVVGISVRESGEVVELVVEDSGPGIAASERERLFRFDRKGTRRGGLGVGLWVVKTLCEAMGGSVRIGDSVSGARFIVALPRG
jgi:signal transduction histidine kinase